jgi:hypothetical protein
MITWQFLIQQEGDRSWLPIETDGDIPHGRYRFAARTAFPNIPVVVEIAHIADGHQPRCPRIQRRSCRTNSQGLLTMLPYSKIPAGTLAIRCLVQTDQNTLQHYCTKFHVFDPQGHGEANAGTPQSISTDQHLELEMSCAKAEATPPAAPATVTTPYAQPPHQPPQLVSLARSQVLAAHIQLTEAPLTGTRGETVQVEGHIRLEIDQEIDPAGVGHEWHGRLHTNLYDPQTAGILLTVDHPLYIACVDPITNVPFSYSIAIPPQIDTHILLGEVVLEMPTLASDGIPESDDIPSLATESFVLAVGLQDLLTVLAEPAQPTLQVTSTGEEPIDEPKLAQPPKPTLDLTFVSMLNSAKPVSSMGIAARQSIPPKIAPVPPRITRTSTASPSEPSALSKAWQAVQLPTFAAGKAARLASLAADAASATSSIDSEDELLEMIDRLAKTDEEEYEGNSSAEPATESSAQSGIHSQAATEASSSAELDPIDTAFRSLNLQQRFWTRLHTLVGDTELSSWIAPITGSESGSPLDVVTPGVADLEMVNVADRLHDLESATPSAALDTANASTSHLSQSASTSLHHGPEDDLWLSQEIVVDEEFSLPEHLMAERSPVSPSTLSVVTLPDDQPIPAPVLHVPVGELIAGKSIPVRVTLPETSGQICIKLWFFDYQTRSVLGEPRWLVNFMPDGFGNVEAVTYLTVPLGSSELQLAAIAIEIPTQRESYRSTVDRRVVPADLPILSLEPLGL